MCDNAPVRESRTHDYRREALGAGREIRRFEAIEPGRYEVVGVGPDVEVGDRLRFTLKGSQTLELVLDVQTIEPKLIPTHGWQAVLTGQDFASLDIHRWAICCDECGRQAPLEFAAPSGADGATCAAAAAARAADLGWTVSEQAHRCPVCASEVRS